MSAMTTPRARAGRPYEHQPMPVDFADDEPTNSTLEHDYERFRCSQVERVNAMPINKEPPFEMHEPTAWQRIRTFFTKEWK